MNLRDDFLLDPDVVFLNHGSFGATPQPVFDNYQRWQRALERQPVHFMERVLAPALHAARTRLGQFLHADSRDVIFVPNTTFGVNLVARALLATLPLAAGDEVLTTDHEYGACERAWRQIMTPAGVRWVVQRLPLPVDDAATIVEQIWAGVTPRTRVLYLSHITSATALTLPVATLVARAQAAGILTVIDGAHAPGQIDLDLTALNADFYIGNLHKWVCAPKGAGFLYARRDRQPLLRPLVISWDWGEVPALDSGTPFLNELQWQGTNDPAAWLAVPAALDWLESHNWPALRARCQTLVQRWLDGMQALTGLAPLYPPTAGFFHTMAAAPLPPVADIRAYKQQLIDAHGVEMPCYLWQDRPLTRISVHVYNSVADVDAALAATAALLGLA